MRRTLPSNLKLLHHIAANCKYVCHSLAAIADVVPRRMPAFAALSGCHVLQALVEGVEEPETALQSAGLFFNDGAIAYLTPAQKAVLLTELEDMEVRVLLAGWRPASGLAYLIMRPAVCFSNVSMARTCEGCSAACSRNNTLLLQQVTLGYDMAAYYVTDCLLRARFTNNRMEVARRV